MQHRSSSPGPAPLGDRSSQRPTSPPPEPGGDWSDLCSALEFGDEGDAQLPADDPSNAQQAEPAAKTDVSWELADGDPSAGSEASGEVRLHRKPTPRDLPPLRPRRFIPPIPREDPE